MAGGFNFSRQPVDVPRVETKNRRIVTKIPVPESLEIFESLDKNESTSMHGQMPIVWNRAQDCQVYDSWGNKWIDFTSTIFVTNSGHGNKRIIEALKLVLEKPLLHTYTFASHERADYLAYLIEQTPPQFEKAFLLSAGTEATECALKLMRLNAWSNGKRKPGIIGFEGNWHGRTMGAQMMSYNPSQKEWIGYLDPNIYHLPFPYPWRADAMENPEKYFLDSIERLLNDNNIDPDKDLAGFILETFQGWGSVFYPVEYVQAVESFARKHNILVTFDEMQSGFGRTGTLFGYMHYDVEPDILCCGKGAGSSLPLSIVLGSQEIMDLPEIGSMSSTHSANPMACAAGKANLEAIIEGNLLGNSVRMGQMFHDKLNQIKETFPDHIAYVCGKGMIAALIFIDSEGRPLDLLCSKICEKAMQSGLLLVHTGRESIKIGPPLTISEEVLMEGLQVLEESISYCINEACNDCR